MFSALFYFLCYHLDPFYGTDLFKFAIYAVLSFGNGTGHTQGIIAGIYHRLRCLGTAFVYLSSCSRIGHFDRVLNVVNSMREQKLSVTGDLVEEQV
jgi:pentatricopeptide repeat protein